MGQVKLLPLGKKSFEVLKIKFPENAFRLWRLDQSDSSESDSDTLIRVVNEHREQFASFKLFR